MLSVYSFSDCEAVWEAAQASRDLQRSRGGVQGSMGQRTKLPYASCPLHTLKILFLLLSLHVTVLEGKQKQNIYTVIRSFIQICIYE